MRYTSLFPLLLSVLSSTLWAGSPVNVNSASADELASALDGVGLSKAQAIVEFRDRNGSFKHADELVKVKGIGLATVNQNREYIQLKGGLKVAGESDKSR